MTNAEKAAAIIKTWNTKTIEGHGLLDEVLEREITKALDELSDKLECEHYVVVKLMEEILAKDANEPQSHIKIADKYTQSIDSDTLIISQKLLSKFISECEGDLDFLKFKLNEYFK